MNFVEGRQVIKFDDLILFWELFYFSIGSLKLAHVSDMNEGFELSSADDVIGMRKFARMVGVDLRAVQKAIDAGRISENAVAKTKAGRKLYRKRALEEWNASRVPGRNNRFGELPGDEDIQSDSVEQDRNGEDKSKKDWYRIKVKEEARLVETRRKIADIELAELEDRMHNGDDTARVWSGMILACRQSILGIPSTAAPKISGKLRGILLRSIKQILTDASIEPSTIDGIEKELTSIMEGTVTGDIKKILDAHCRGALSELARHDEAEVTEETEEN